jgi:8-oxoguanine deaminase
MSADIVAYRLDSLSFAGAQHDPLAALVFCQPPSVDVSVINGKIVVKDGQLTVTDLPMLIEKHNKLSLSLINGD